MWSILKAKLTYREGVNNIKDDTRSQRRCEQYKRWHVTHRECVNNIKGETQRCELWRNTHREAVNSIKGGTHSQRRCEQYKRRNSQRRYEQECDREKTNFLFTPLWISFAFYILTTWGSPVDWNIEDYWFLWHVIGKFYSFYDFVLHN